MNNHSKIRWWCVCVCIYSNVTFEPKNGYSVSVIQRANETYIQFMNHFIIWAMKLHFHFYISVHLSEFRTFKCSYLRWEHLSDSLGFIFTNIHTHSDWQKKYTPEVVRLNSFKYLKTCVLPPKQISYFISNKIHIQWDAFLTLFQPLYFRWILLRCTQWMGSSNKFYNICIILKMNVCKFNWDWVYIYMCVLSMNPLKYAHWVFPGHNFIIQNI